MPTPRPEGMTGFLYETVAALRSDTAKRPADELQHAHGTATTPMSFGGAFGPA
jgi:hypothetical protein